MSNRPEKILVVDDEPRLRASLCEFLRAKGFEVLEAADGEVGLGICLQESPDLVLLDISLPGTNGFEVCRTLKANESVREIPVIFISGLMGPQEKLDAFAIGAVDFISKPFHFEELRARVFTHLELQRRRRELQASQVQLEDALDALKNDQRILLQINERLSQSEAIQSHFIDHMRNEINDPLGSILALAEEICDPRVSSNQAAGFAQRIRAEALKLDFQYRNILCAAELEAGNASPSISSVDLDSVIQDTTTALGGRVIEKAQILEVHVSEEARLIATDAEKLRVILANLLANAIEFSPELGRIELWVRRQGEALVIQVRDNGIGISESDVSIIFERFRQIDSGYTRAHRGQGLGLPVVKALVELLDGEVSVESSPGQGSIFTCRLPLCTPSDNPDSFAFDGNLVIYDKPLEL